MFSPNNPVSPLYPSALSPPHKKLNADVDPLQQDSSSSFLSNNHANISYTRGLPLKELTPPVENEDQKFFRLAKEALVATAKGAAANNNNNNGSSTGTSAGVIDSTLQDLLTRLLYASAPHGNPMSQLSSLRQNSIGLVEVHDEYENFPDFSNNIFSRSERGAGGDTAGARHHPSGNEPGWNFLIGEPVTFKTPGEDSSKKKRKRDEDEDNDGEEREARGKKKLHTDDPDEDAEDVEVIDISTKKPQLPSSNGPPTNSRKYSQDPTRKFPCDKCPMSFRRSSDLKRHEKQHLSIPPNICEFCGKGFARKDALKRHVGTLTCKRNADKKLYIENLNYLHSKGSLAEDDEDDDDDDRSDDEDDDEDEDNIKRQFPTYGYQKENNWQI
ncbi:Transcriptional regulator MET32 [Candida viswanathii]|uniref:Transcriptional regulator MET32 n=1 Tax=Candida viswanathii TaxID=5486 RepID=A0A367XMX1_9ASCO|nr:Transcriptional regulator MET32 [Candida viswanathii]